MNMKHLILLTVILSFYTFTTIAQNQNDINGSWQGNLVISQSMELPIIFKISGSENDGYKCMMDSPSQGAKDIPAESVTLNNDSIFINVQVIAGSFSGKIDWDNSTITGKWSQAGQSFDLTIEKTDEVKTFNRPQEPEKPYPYKNEEINFDNKIDNLKLAGTLTYPDKGNSFPAVVLISGSGPQNRNEELMAHKPFLVLADHLTKNGFAVLRFDDRGVAESEGAFSAATTEDFVNDALAAVEYLKTRKEIDNNKIGLIGHSEGGLVAPLASVKTEDISFIILMAGPGLKGEEILLLQSKLIAEVNGISSKEIENSLNFSSAVYDAIKSSSDFVVAEKKIREYFWHEFSEMTDEEKQTIGDPEKFLEMQLKVALTPWFKYFLEYDPAPALQKVTIPVLAIIGEKDLQVPPKENLEAIEEALKRGGNKNFTVKELPDLNHLFQTAETGSPLEYGKIEETISPVALDTITEWLKKVTR